MIYRGRIAPSPTGLLHLGHAATFWNAYQRSFADRGTLIFRMEDLDPHRSKAEFATAAMEDLRWLGIPWDEGPDIGGPLGPYSQSKRHPLYAAALKQLKDGGFIYPCRCTRKDLAQLAQAPHEDEPVYPGSCRPEKQKSAEVSNNASLINKAGTGVNWRFRVPDGETIAFRDGRLGPQRFTAGEDFGDFLVWRKDGVPAYQLAVAIDDAAMQITEVVRGADLLKSTARQILVCRALGLSEPRWRHCPLVTDSQGQRLAKRNDALSLQTLRASGITPKAVLKMAAGDLEPAHPQRGPDL